MLLAIALAKSPFKIRHLCQNCLIANRASLDDTRLFARREQSLVMKKRYPAGSRSHQSLQSFNLCTITTARTLRKKQNIFFDYPRLSIGLLQQVVHRMCKRIKAPIQRNVRIPRLVSTSVLARPHQKCLDSTCDRASTIVPYVVPNHQTFVSFAPEAIKHHPEKLP